MHIASSLLKKAEIIAWENNNCPIDHTSFVLVIGDYALPHIIPFSIGNASLDKFREQVRGMDLDLVKKPYPYQVFTPTCESADESRTEFIKELEKIFDCELPHPPDIKFGLLIAVKNIEWTAPKGDA